MNRMGSSCSAQRNHQTDGASSRNRGRNKRSEGSASSARTSENGNMVVSPRSSLRYSVVSALPDRSIAALYPVEDNYVMVEGNSSLRSPKTLAELATDALCRSLAHLQGELPAGLPQDVVDCIAKSLLQHAALNATTLRALCSNSSNCESLQTLCLANCRGVTDEWLEPLATSLSVSQQQHSSSSCFYYSQPPDLYPVRDDSSNDDGAGGGGCCGLESMDLEEKESDGEDHDHDRGEDDDDDDDVFYHTFELHPTPPAAAAAAAASAAAAAAAAARGGGGGEDSSCSTSSFVSANSQPHTPTVADHDDDHLMMMTMMTSSFHEDCNHHHHGNNNSNNTTMMEGMMMCIADDSKQSASPSTTRTTCSLAGATPPPSSVTSNNNLTVLDLRGSQRLSDRGLLQLVDCGLTRLQVARLDNCHAIQGRGLLCLASSHRTLHTLSLAHCRRLTDEAVINIAHISSLQALSLDGCRCLTDRSMAAMADLYNLSKLDLSQCDLITDRGLEMLQHLHLLQELSLGWCRQITDAGINALTLHQGRSSNLKILRLARCTALTDAGMEHLQRLLALEELNLNGCSNITSAALTRTLEKLQNMTTLDVSYCPGILRSSWQGKIDKLRSLELCYSTVRDSQLARLTKLPALLELNLDSCPVGDWALGHLADNGVTPNLQTLDLADTDVTDAGMVHIAKFTKLKHLSLFYCNISNGGLRHISKLEHLETLNLDSRDISDDGLRHLRQLQKLKSLDIFSGRITDSGCGHIAHITSLITLELCGGGVGDLGCTLLAASLENLTSLNLSQNEKISNRGAAALAALSNLKALNLSNTRVNSSALRYFSGLTQLQSLTLYGCRGIEDGTGVDTLQDGLPNLKCLRLTTAADEDGMMLDADPLHDTDLFDDLDISAAAAMAAAAASNMSHDDMDEDDDDDDDEEEEYSDHD